MGRKKECLLIENEQHHYFAETASSSSAHTFFFLEIWKKCFLTLAPFREIDDKQSS